MTKECHKISVVIPNYNRAATIGQTLKSILHQSLRPYEIIVVDDGSTDQSIEILKAFGPDITLIRQQNRGPGAARNAGLKVASGDFIQFMDSDDLASLNKLEIQARIAIEQGADIVYGPWAKVWIQEATVQFQDIVLQQHSLPLGRSPLLWFLTSWSMIFQQCIVRRSLLDSVGGYREDMRLYEDGELFVRMLLAGAKLVHEQETLTLYRLEDHGKLTGSGSDNRQKTIDRAHFFVSAVGVINQHPPARYIIEHPEFRLGAWRAFVDLTRLADAPPQLLLNLENIAKYSHKSFTMRLKDRIDKKQKGLQKKLIGHRWPFCYMPKAATEAQIRLIEEMGLSIQ